MSEGVIFVRIVTIRGGDSSTRGGGGFTWGTTGHRRNFIRRLLGPGGGSGPRANTWENIAQESETKKTH